MATRNVLANIKYSDNNVHRLKSGDGFTPQAITINSSNEMYVFCSGTTNNHILKIDSSGNYSDIGAKDDYGHANGATYCSKNKLFYTTAYNYKSEARKYQVYAVDPATFKIKFTVNLDMTCTGIAYDNVVDKFYVSNTSGIGVYSYDSFNKAGKATRTKYISKQFSDGRANQDICGFNGIVMAVMSFEGSKSPNAVAYIDLYDSSSGKYKGSWSFYSGELESLVIDKTGVIHLLTAWNRRYIKTNFKFNLKGSAGSDNPFTSRPSILPQWIEAMTTQFNWSKNQVYDFSSYPTVENSRRLGTCITFPAVSLQRIGLLPEGGYFYYNPNSGRISGSPANYVVDHPDIFTLSYPNKTIAELGDAIKKGDIVGYGEPGYHTQVFMGFNDDGRPIFNTMGHYRALNSTSGYENRKINMLVHLNGIDGGYAGAGLVAHPEKLYSSDNYEYIERKEEEESEASKFTSRIKDLLDDLSSMDFTAIPDTPQNISKITSTNRGSLDKTKLSRTRVNGEVYGPPLPVALDPVEAPFVELTIGGHKFGVFENSNKFDKYPNYIQSLNVKKTNASMNEYTINLVHQVRPGSNPNFIDELLSKNGYNKITIRYGDANSGVEFIDSNALLIGVNVSFDFTNCNIHYTLSATSSAVSIASHKRTFASTTDKPSNIIYDLLYKDSDEDLLNAFPRMRDKNFVDKNNLIPSNDTAVEIEEFKDVNVLTYIKNLVASMKSVTDGIVNANYMLDFNNGYFSINQVATTYSYDSQLYEVNINFPDDNQVFSFDIDTNYSWPISYNYSGGVSNYNYEISNSGNINTYRTNSSQILDFSSPMQMNVNDNWWKQVTEFPISAKLNCRGLLSPQLLLTYIKINCVYYGNDRITSGIYIVTGQEDSLSGSGYKTTLSLLRVAGYKEHLTVSGRVKT